MDDRPPKPDLVSLDQALGDHPPAVEPGPVRGAEVRQQEPQLVPFDPGMSAGKALVRNREGIVGRPPDADLRGFEQEFAPLVSEHEEQSDHLGLRSCIAFLLPGRPRDFEEMRRLVSDVTTAAGVIYRFRMFFSRDL